MTLELHPTARFGTIGAAVVAALAIAVFACPGIARADSATSGAGSSRATIVPADSTGAFNLTTVTPSAVVLSKPGVQVKVCNRTGGISALDEPSATPPFTPGASSVLEVTYNGRTERIMPGECSRVDAEHVRITTGEPLGPGGQLHGSVAWVH